MSPRELRAAINRLPRVRLAHTPTPLAELPRFSAELGGPRVLVKRDDMTGLAFGGNKTRTLEFTVGAARAKGADVLVAAGFVQSNHCRQAAAAAAKVGMGAVLFLGSDPALGPPDLQGNFLLDHLLGARIPSCLTSGRPSLRRCGVTRSERLAECNQLLRIGEELGANAPYAGRSALWSDHY